MSILAAQSATFADAQNEISTKVREGGPFVITGGGTSRVGMATGAVLSAPDGAMDCDPSALTLTVAAGVTLDEVEATLRAENQRLAFEPPRLGALLGREGTPTVGGVVAGNLSGPRRVTAGACRDFCLGVACVDGRGAVIKNGGRVMKNVTGYDLVKLMAGSQGTLGVITEVTMKVQPLPETVVTMVIHGLSDTQAVAAMSAALGTPFDVTGAAHIPREGEGRTLIRLEGFETSLRYRIGALRQHLASYGAAEIEWDAARNETTWRAIRDVERFHGVEGNVWRVNLPPSEAAATVAAVQPEDVIYDWGGNRLWMLTKAGADVRAKMTSGHATLVRASDETKRSLGVFHPENPVTARLSDGLRNRFDPERKFNRGMMG
ncbi:FAD-binding protein [Celeribacter sp.]|uniref:FAD-binding protein n=1 Tax=Celeribacter sp. TaxID=1890673 RepID=UPI003A94130A